MGLLIREFSKTTNRARVSAGEPLEVALEASWVPLLDGGTANARLDCETPGYSVSPQLVPMSVMPGGGITRKRFSIIISGPGGDLVDVVATAPDGSSDSITIKVV
jgi:hypothetical protein